jgi:lactoylglutathione lyase
VSDLDRASRFYIEALGAVAHAFADVSARMPPGHRALLEISEDMHTTVKFVELDGTLIELICFSRDRRHPGHVGSANRRPMNQLGLTHLGIRIADPAEYSAIQARVRTFGGQIIESTRFTPLEFEGRPNESVFALDPDGTRLELMRVPAHYPVGGTVWTARALRSTAPGDQPATRR